MLLSFSSALSSFMSSWMSLTTPLVVRAILSLIGTTFSTFLLAMKLPAVALLSAANTTQSLHTSPTVVVPVFKTSFSFITNRLLIFMQENDVLKTGTTTVGLV